RFGSEQSGADYVKQLWAARKAGALSSEIRLHGPNPEIVRELKRLALRYGILTEYTSYWVQEPNQVANNRQMREFRAPAPEAQAGAEAVERSREARKLAGSLSLDAIVVTGMGRAADSLAAVPGGRPDRSQRIGGRLFVWRDSVWTDIAHGDSLRARAVPVPQGVGRRARGRPGAGGLCSGPDTQTRKREGVALHRGGEHGAGRCATRGAGATTPYAPHRGAAGEHARLR